MKKIPIAIAALLVIAGIVTIALNKAEKEMDEMTEEIQRRLDKGDADRALKLMRKALKKDPSDWRMFNDMGNILMARGEMEKAAEAFGKALEIDPMQPLTHNNLGALAMKKGNAEEALKHFYTAVELDGEYVPAVYNLGTLMLLSQRYSVAMEHFAKVLKLKPDHAGALFDMARIKRMTGAPEEALEYYRKGLEHNPGYVEGMIEYGMLYFAMGDKSAAEDVLTKCVELNPDDADAYHALGLFMRDNGKIKLAEKNLKKAVELDTENPSFRIDYALVLLYLDGKKDAGPGERQIKKALKIAPDDGYTVYMSGIFYDDAGMPEKAEPLYRKAISLGYRKHKAKAYLAEALIKQGEKQNAAELILELDKELAEDDQLRGYIERLKKEVQI